MASTFRPGKPIDPDEMIQVVERRLEKLELHSRRSVALHGIRYDVRPDVHRDVAEGMIHELSGYVWMEVIQDEKVTAKFDCEYPADWWQHFKRRWFPGWALRRWPVRMAKVHEEQTHQFRTVALFPEFKYEAPHGCGQYLIRTMAERRWR